MNPTRLDLIWLLLLAATAISWWAAEWRGGGGVTTLVLGLALLKGTLVILDYMGLRGAGPRWRALVVGWLVVVLLAIGTIFLFGAD
ncbi:MAG: cytochrome C oxidase subunit IV family protein [Rhodocyclaceae bacterium]|nr:cytochrome C oxidase subunit IV family protein [Rhodocyclaceae bacterium]